MVEFNHNKRGSSMIEKKQIISINNIKNRIFKIRGVQVMLDKDIANFYEVKAIRLREQVKRNIARFPDDFMFQLTEAEVDIMVSQNAIPSKKQLGGFLPYVFTEQGVAAVSAVTKSKKAEEVSVLLMRAFVEMRKFISRNVNLFLRINNIEQKQIETDNKIDAILDAIEEREIKPNQGIFYDGQVFNAYKFVSGIIRKADRSILLIDNYIDETILDLFSKKKKNVTLSIFTNKITKTL